MLKMSDIDINTVEPFDYIYFKIILLISLEERKVVQCFTTNIIEKYKEVC